MNDCISRQALIKAIEEKSKKLKNLDTINGLCGAVNIALELPSVTPTERTGHWEHFSTWSECSECSWSTGKYISPSKYCPNCGAKMVEPQESEDKE